MHLNVFATIVSRFFSALPLILLGSAEARPVSPQSPTAEIVVDGAKSRAEFRVHGLDPEALAKLAAESASADRWTSLAPVTVGEGTDSPPMLGSYRVSGRDLIFAPRYPLDQTISRYLIIIDGTLLARHEKARLVVDATFEPVQPSDQPRTTVKAVYPTRGVLPENTLKFYVAFSAPMSRGDAYDHIRLLDGAGRPIADPFLELGEELWTVDGERFTLLFDPGRIKRGLRPRDEVGPVLEAGKRYTLVIDSGWLDARGNPLAKEFRKPFRVGPADETVPDPRKWTVDAPRAGTLDPVVIRFPEPLDRALAERLIVVRGPSGGNIAGAVHIESEETVWKLAPKAPWQEGEYETVVGTDLEDLAGNSIVRRFDVDLVEPITPTIRSATVAIRFRIER